LFEPQASLIHFSEAGAHVSRGIHALIFLSSFLDQAKKEHYDQGKMAPTVERSLGRQVKRMYGTSK
jgi:hypothetical protein